MNWLNAFTLGRRAARACAMSSLAVSTPMPALWICPAYFLARASASSSLIVGGGVAWAAVGAAGVCASAREAAQRKASLLDVLENIIGNVIVLGAIPSPYP